MSAIIDRVAMALFMAATVILATQFADDNTNKLIIGILAVTAWIEAIIWEPNDE